MLLPKTLVTICSVWLLCSYHSLDALIVPQEIPSLLAVIFSNVPPIKKGTDSRLGFGFRLGEHADFQVLVELGPQKETRPIGDQDGDSSFNKRQISKAEQNALIRQQLREQMQQQELTSTERNAANWLENWSQDMNAVKKKPSKSKSKQRDTKKQQNEKSSSLPNLPVLPSQSLQQLQLLYKMATSTIAPPTVEVATTEEAAILDARAIAERLKRKSQVTKELMNVSLEDGE